MSCHRVIDGLWEICLPFLNILQQRALITSPLYWCCQFQCDMHHVCGENGFYHLVAPYSIIAHNVISWKCIVIKVEWYCLRMKAFSIHVFTYWFTLTCSLKWIWFWLMNNHAWTDLPFNQYPCYVRMSIFPAQLCASPEKKIKANLASLQMSKLSMFVCIHSLWQFWNANICNNTWIKQLQLPFTLG